MKSENEKQPLLLNFSPPFKKIVPVNVLQLLAAAGFDENDEKMIQSADIQMQELVALLNKSYYGKLLSLLSIGDLIENICLWPLIRESAIRGELINIIPLKEADTSIQSVKSEKQEVDENDNESSKFKSDATQINVSVQKMPLSNRFLRPRGKSLLLRDAAVLTRVYALDGTFEGAGFIADRVWKLLLLTILSFDIYQYATDPIYRFITPTKDIVLGTSRYGQSLSVILMNPYVWPIILGLPFVWGMGNSALQVWRMRNWNQTKSDNFIQAFQTYRGHFFTDFLTWLPNSLTFGLLPASRMKRQIEITEKALLWDGQLEAKKYKALFLSLEECLFHAKKFTLIQLIGTLAYLAEGISERDYPELIKAGISKEMLISLLYVKTQAFHRLRQTAKGKLENKEQIITISLFISFYAHYHLWRLGQPQSKLLQPLFWVYQLISYYLYVYLGARIVQNVADLINEYVAKIECLNAGRQWLYLQQTANFTCSVCGNWPISYKDVFNDVSCWNAYLLWPRTTNQILAAIERLNFQQIKVVDFTAQNLTEIDFIQILPALQEKVSSLQQAYFNVTGSPVLITEVGAKIIADFMVKTHVQQLYLDYLVFSQEATQVFAESLNQSSVQTLSFINNCFTDSCFQTISLIELSKQLPNSSLEELILDTNKFYDVEITSLANALLISPSIKNLSLERAMVYGEKGISTLIKVLPYTEISNLNLFYQISYDVEDQKVPLIEILPQCKKLINLIIDCCSSDAELIALGRVLNQTSAIPSFFIELDQITDVGLIAISDGLLTSQVESLQLWQSYGLNITSDAFSIFTEALGKSLTLKSLEISMDETIFVNLAPELKHSSIETLYIDSDYASDATLIALGNILPESNINSLSGDVIFNVTDTGLNALEIGLKRSLIQNFSINLSLNMNMTSLGIASLIRNLPIATIQSLALGLGSQQNGYLDLSQAIEALADLLPFSPINNVDIGGFAGVNEQSFTYFANNLRNSALEVLGLGIEIEGERGVIALAQALPYSKIFDLELNPDLNGTNIIAAFAENIPNSVLQSLWMGGTIAADISDIQSFAKALPGSPLQELTLYIQTPNIPGDLVAELIAAQLSTAPLSGDDLIEKFDAETQVALANANPNTNLTYLNLDAADNITTIGVKALCRVMPQTNIQLPTGLWIVADIDSSEVDIRTCVISSAPSNCPFWVFRTIHIPFQLTKEYLRWMYETTKQTLEFSKAGATGEENMFEEIYEEDNDDMFDPEVYFSQAINNHNSWSNSVLSLPSFSQPIEYQSLPRQHQDWRFADNTSQSSRNFYPLNAVPVPAAPIDTINSMMAIYMVYKITAPVFKGTFSSVKNLVSNAINFFSTKEESTSQFTSTQSRFNFFNQRTINNSVITQDKFKATALKN